MLIVQLERILCLIERRSRLQRGNAYSKHFTQTALLMVDNKVELCVLLCMYVYKEDMFAKMIVQFGKT